KRDDLSLKMELGRTLFQTQGPLPEGRAIWANALDGARAGDDFLSQVTCLTWLANYDLWAGKFRSVVDLAHQLRGLANAHNQVAFANSIDRQAGFALRYLGEFSEAHACLARALSWRSEENVGIVAAQFVDPRRTAQGILAILLWMEGYPAQASRLA